MSRASTFTPEIGEQIAERLELGEPLAEICRSEGMPCRKTVYLWTAAHPEFATRIADARVKGFDALAESCLVIANTPVDGIETTTKPDGTVEVRRGDMLGHRKLQIETRLKLLAKWDPKRYGDKVQLDHSGGIAVSVDDMSDAALAKIAAGAVKPTGEGL